MAQERLTVNNLAVLTNATGATTDIDDDPDSPDGLWITSNAGGNFELRGQFQDPSKTLIDGTGLQEFRTLIRRSSANGGPTGGNSVSFSIQLYENATLISTLNTGTLPAGGSQDTVYSGTWDSTGRTGSLIEVRVIQTAGATGNGANRRYIDVGAMEWNAEISATRYIIIS